MILRGAVVAMIAVLALSTTGARSNAAQRGEDAKFENLAKDFIEEFLRASPEAATGLGNHRFDDRLDDYSLGGRDADRARARKYLDALAGINVNRLSPVNNVDYRIMRSRLEYNLFSLDTLREYEWNPLTYNVGGSIYALVARDFAPLPQRLRSVKSRLQALPEVVANAKKNLKNPPRVHTETAIAQNKGNISLVRDELDTFIAQAPEMKAELAPAQAIAMAALEDYGKWLENTLLPRSNSDFRIGDEKFRRKLGFALESDLTKEQILQRAEADLRSTQDEMYRVALPLHKKFFPEVTDAGKLNDKRFVIRAVLNRLAESRPTNDTIVDLAKQYLQTTTDFVRANNLVTVPDAPVKIIVMPEFDRGVAVAYCNAAGPLEKNGETFYAISPTPKDWTEQRVSSFFREYNNYMVQDLTIHEAMPGHYLQLALANRFKAPTQVRAIFQSGTFAEGWAVYAEGLMAEKGYGGAEVRMQQLKMRLRMIINAIIDQKIHTDGMTEQAAKDLMMNEGFQEEGEAAGKWRRAQLSSTQLSTYYVGATEVADIRRAYEAKNGKQRNMRTMHDLMLSFGSPAPKYVRELIGL